MGTFRRELRAFGQDRNGGVAITFALALLPVMLATGAALDYSRGGSVKTAMQAALDAAALSLAKDAAASRTAPSDAAATSRFLANFHRPEATAVVITPVYDAPTGTLTLTGSASLKTMLMGLGGIREMQIGALSKARANPGNEACVIALDPATNKALAVSGNGSISIPNCGIYVNSSARIALEQKGASRISAKSISVVGGVSGSNISPAPKTDQPVLADPLAAIPEPTIPGGCSYTNYTFSVPTTIPGGTVYCGPIKFEANITFGPGIHYFKDALVTTGSGNSLVGNGVMLYFDASTNFSSTTSGTISLKAMQSGTYTGIALFGPRSPPTMPTVRLTSSQNYFVNGTIYMPRTRFELYGTADLTVSSKSGYVIAWQFFYQGDSSFTFDAFGSAVPMGVGAAQVVLVQ